MTTRFLWCCLIRSKHNLNKMAFLWTLKLNALKQNKEYVSFPASHTKFELSKRNFSCVMGILWVKAVALRCCRDESKVLSHVSVKDTDSYSLLLLSFLPSPHSHNISHNQSPVFMLKQNYKLDLETPDKILRSAPNFSSTNLMKTFRAFLFSPSFSRKPFPQPHGSSGTLQSTK